jgi:hypothetical protein
MCRVSGGRARGGGEGIDTGHGEVAHSSGHPHSDQDGAEELCSRSSWNIMLFSPIRSCHTLLCPILVPGDHTAQQCQRQNHVRQYTRTHPRRPQQSWPQGSRCNTGAAATTPLLIRLKQDWMTSMSKGRRDAATNCRRLSPATQPSPSPPPPFSKHCLPCNALGFARAQVPSKQTQRLLQHEATIWLI